MLLIFKLSLSSIIISLWFSIISFLLFCFYYFVSTILFLLFRSLFDLCFRLLPLFAPFLLLLFFLDTFDWNRSMWFNFFFFEIKND
jgi:hypothetical protein